MSKMSPAMSSASTSSASSVASSQVRNAACSSARSQSLRVCPRCQSDVVEGDASRAPNRASLGAAWRVRGERAAPSGLAAPAQPGPVGVHVAGQRAVGENVEDQGVAHAVVDHLAELGLALDGHHSVAAAAREGRGARGVGAAFRTQPGSGGERALGHAGGRIERGRTDRRDGAVGRQRSLRRPRLQRVAELELPLAVDRERVGGPVCRRLGRRVCERRAHDLRPVERGRDRIGTAHAHLEAGRDVVDLSTDPTRSTCRQQRPPRRAGGAGSTYPTHGPHPSVSPSSPAWHASSSHPCTGRCRDRRARARPARRRHPHGRAGAPLAVLVAGAVRRPGDGRQRAAVDAAVHGGWVVHEVPRVHAEASPPIPGGGASEDHPCLRRPRGAAHRPCRPARRLRPRLRCHRRTRSTRRSTRSPRARLRRARR